MQNTKFLHIGSYIGYIYGKKTMLSFARIPSSVSARDISKVCKIYHSTYLFSYFNVEFIENTYKIYKNSNYTQLIKFTNINKII